MNFDDKNLIVEIDQSNFLSGISNLDKKISLGWEYVTSQKKIKNNNFDQICFWGFQELETEFDLLLELSKPDLDVSLRFLEEIYLPRWCKHSEQLIICLVDQKNIFQMERLLDAIRGTDQMIFVLELGDRYHFNNLKNMLGHWKLKEEAFSRTWIGYDLMILYGLLYQLNLVADISNGVKRIEDEVARSLEFIDISIPSSQNPAKRLAGQMVGRWIKIIGGEITKPIAQRWSEQINKSAKHFSYAEDIHHLRHHTLSGIFYPENMVQQSMVVFLKSNLNDAYTESLIDRIKEELMCNGIGTDFYSIRGDTKFSQIWSSILFGDFVAYYLAIANQCDPYPTAEIEIF